MRRISAAICFSILISVHQAGAGSVTESDFEAKDTKSLLNLCTVSSDDPLYKEAINFCHGYLVGAYHYYKVSHPEGGGFICPPDPPPSRNESIKQFISWAQSHPEHMNEAPVETEFRFLSATWPCK